MTAPSGDPPVERPLATTHVLIIGSGPAGACGGAVPVHAGRRQHHDHQVPLDREQPRAHITNQRTMEIFRDVGVEDQVLAEATPHELMGDTVFCTSIAGEEIGRILTWGTHPARRGRLPARLARA